MAKNKKNNRMDTIQLSNLKAIDIAKYFVARNLKDQKGLSNKKLQKLLYYAQAWSMVFNNQTLFKDDIQAWIHGPAILEVYNEYKEFGAEEIKKEVDLNAVTKLLSKEQVKILDMVWESYGKFDANYLEILSHNEKPWQETRKGLEVYDGSDRIIPIKLMKSYYTDKYEQASKK